MYTQNIRGDFSPLTLSIGDLEFVAGGQEHRRDKVILYDGTVGSFTHELVATESEVCVPSVGQQVRCANREANRLNAGFRFVLAVAGSCRLYATYTETVLHMLFVSPYCANRTRHDDFFAEGVTRTEIHFGSGTIVTGGGGCYFTVQLRETEIVFRQKVCGGRGFNVAHPTQVLFIFVFFTTRGITDGRTNLIVLTAQRVATDTVADVSEKQAVFIFDVQDRYREGIVLIRAFIGRGIADTAANGVIPVIRFHLLRCGNRGRLLGRINPLLSISTASNNKRKYADSSCRRDIEGF
ncbi:hypothetical protein A11S_2170 [Micavibrio aeruginosavorus EPB]|uniref:Uncharacterized protein n=1 Tax=Micavibrio aeruginosavorus EPB TaxID=349215 RepID=M4VIG1_9BACT|nr:hypothetical protein A11S_2170 [Micavibrio aeruginosavorus EPB]